MVDNCFQDTLTRLMLRNKGMWSCKLGADNLETIDIRFTSLFLTCHQSVVDALELERCPF